MQGGTDPRIQAKHLYWQGHAIAEIARLLDLPYGTVDTWKRRDGWDEASIIHRIDAHVECRLMQLIAKAEKTDQDLAEIEQLGRVLERTARIERYQGGGKESDLNPKRKGRGRKKEEKNVLTEEQVDALAAAFEEGLYDYQRTWLNAKRYRVRNIQKSRQIGATWYFAREALIDALRTGDNQIFLSASKAQAHVFRQYIVEWVAQVTGVQLVGSPIVLPNGATLYFLGTNTKTAQSYHGHVYLDEYAWIAKFIEFRKVASAMATHKKWRITYFSTPSTIGHQSHDFWSGALHNKGRSRADQVAFDVSHVALRAGMLGPDGQWRHMVTIHDAAAQGCDLFDVASLRREYNDQDFANLFECAWVDDAQSFFTFDELQRCLVDSWEAWDDFNPADERPIGTRKVWIGYDPSRSRDNASIVVIDPPSGNQTKYRVLEKLTFSGADFQAQAEAIRKLTQRYTVEHIGIDVTGIGQGVYELVKVFYPGARPITYSVESKARMVLKAKHIIGRKLLEFDAGWHDVVGAFLSIRKTMTTSGRQTTFAASRSEETGHADAAWATMHALDRVHFAEFDTETGGSTAGGIVEFF